MPEKEQNNQSDFMIEKIKERPVNRKKLLRRTIITASMAVIFGLIACVTFLVLEPLINNWLYPEEEPQIVVFPEDQQEMSPEDMLAENLPPAETPTPSPSPEPQDVVLDKQQIEDILSGIVLDKGNYKQLYTAMSDYTTELNRYIVTVTAVTSNIDWFNNVQESRNQTAGVIITDNGKELLVLTPAGLLRSAESLILTFYNGVQVNAVVKQLDSSTGIAILAVPLTDLPESVNGENLVYPALGSANSNNMAGVPVIAMGSPMGISNSVGYGMITSSSYVYSAIDRNYRILQTDINGSQSASGVLFDLEGQIVGVITDNKTGSDVKNVIYAYGITDLRRIMEKLSNGNAVPYLGISGVTVSADINTELGVPQGAFVRKVDMDSPAMLAGVQQGDVITNIGGRNVVIFNDYSNALMMLEPGQTINITVMRKVQDEFKEMNFAIEVGEKME